MRHASLPEEIKEIMMYLRSLDFEDEPDYAYLHGQLEALCARVGIKARPRSCGSEWPGARAWLQDFEPDPRYDY